MKKKCLQIKKNQLLPLTFSVLVLLLNCFNQLHAQALTGSKTIPSTNFPTIKSAVDSLNAQGVGTGGVIFNVSAGYTETSLVSIAMTATGTLANPIIFRKDPLTIGANPLITAYVGTLLASSATSVDGIWSFTGSDFVTIDGIDLLDPTSNTTATTTMEFGYGFFKASATDGANNNTIRNCTITLNRVNGTAATGPRWAGSVGIELSACTPLAVGTTITQTSIAGASSNNKFYSNTIQNCNGGVALGGSTTAVAAPFTLADLNNDVGGNSLLTGNTIINFGGGVGVTGACMAVWASNQWSFNISYNTINNNTGLGVNHGGTNRGIFAAANSPGASANINNNTITIAAGPTVGASNWNIDIEMAQSGANGNVININNNRLLNCTHTAASTSTVPYTAIWLNTAATTVNCNNNYINGFTYNGAGTGVGQGISHCILSQFAGIGTLNINNNIIDSTVIGGTGVGGTHNNIGVTTAPTLVLNINGNTITRTFLNATGTGAKTINGITFTAASLPTSNINDNLIDSLTRNGTTGGTTVGILQSGGTTGTSTVNVRRNTVRNLSISGTGTVSTLNGIQLNTGTIICDSNTVFNLSCLKATGTGTLSGINDAASPTNETFSNNRIYNLTHLGTGIVNGLFTNTVAGTRLVNNNQVFSLIGNGGNVVGLSMTTSSPTITRNRIYSLRSNGTTTGTVFGISLTTLGAAGSATITNNLIDSLVAPNFSGTTDAIRGISSTITTTSTTLRIYYNTINLSATTGGTNFSSAALFFTGGTTATTATLDLRNNILVNNSIANGTGNAVALRNATTGIGN
ncbi:MAG: beta strand repeat-containing protein, partial [Candidatus Methylacidiphilales bacterium]